MYLYGFDDKLQRQRLHDFLGFLSPDLSIVSGTQDLFSIDRRVSFEVKL